VVARPAPIRQCLIAATIFVAGWSSAPAQDARRPTRILLLFQQQAETSPMVEFTQPLRREVLRGQKGPVEFYQESLDLDRFADRQAPPRLKTYLENKYRDIDVDVVVPVGRRALQFAIGPLASVFPRASIVFALNTAPQTNAAALPRNVTGRLGEASRFEPTVAMARRLQPDAERVVIVGGASPADSTSIQAALTGVSGAAKGLPVTLLTGMPLEVMLRRLHNLPRRSIVIFANFRRDALGQVFDPVDLVGTMAHASSAPMYTQLASYVGEGLVGGYVLKFDDEGAATGRLIRRVLHRGPEDPMPPVEMFEKNLVVDWRALRRWNLDEKRLPPGTEVLFREPSLWARYRTAVLLSLAVFSLELTLIALLLVERQRRKRAQLELRERSAYEQTIARLTTDAVRHAPEEAPRALEDALSHIAEYAGASAATLIQESETDAGAPVRLTWAAHTNGTGPSMPPAPPLQSSVSRLEIPLVADGARIGTLELHRERDGGWPAQLIRRLDSAGEVIAGAIARSRALRTLRRGEELNRAVLASLSPQIAILDGNGTIIRVNEAWRQVSMRGGADESRDDFVGTSYLEECRRAEIRGCEEAAAIRDGIEAVLQRRAWPFRFEYHSADPVDRWCELFVDRLQFSEGGAIVTHFDITDRRLAERRADETRRQVAHMGRMALVGELAATISHELRQPLAAIRVNAEAGAHLLAAAPPDVSEAREIFQSIVGDDVRAVELIEGVRKLLRKEEPVTTIVDLNQVCRDAIRLLQHDAVLRGVRLELVLAPVTPFVTGDQVQLQQLVLNLALNGLEAAGAGATERSVVVTVEHELGHAEVVVRDSGSGIGVDVQPHLFESFFSTKIGGLGLGLVIVRSIVERHGGRITVSNDPSGGAAFRVRLPTVEKIGDFSVKFLP